MKIKISKKIISITTFIIVCLSFYYIIINLSAYDFEVLYKKNILLNLLYFSSFIIIRTALNYLSGYIWKLILEFSSNSTVPLIPILSVYIKSSITKYIPSNIVPYISRIYYGDQIGIDKMRIVSSNFLELIFGLISTTAILVLFLLLGLAHFPNDISFNINYNRLVNYLLYTLIIILLLFIVFLIVYKRFNKNILQIIINKWGIFFSKYFSIKFLILNLKIALISFIPVLFGVIILYLMSGLMLDYPLKYSDFFNIIICLSIAGYSGVITPGLPAGLGVKESISVILISLYGYAKSPILLLLILSRIIIVFSDIFSYIIISIYAKKLNLKKEDIKRTA